MNTTHILKKCLAELSADKPRLDYLRGMLETLVDMQSSPVADLPMQGNLINTANTSQDEATLLEARTKAALDRVRGNGEIV